MTGAVLLILACASPADEWWAVEIHGRPIGLEAVWREGDQVRREARYRFGDTEREVVTTATLAADGSLRSVTDRRDGQARRWSFSSPGPFALEEAVRRGRFGRVEVFEPVTGRTLPTELHPADGGVLARSDRGEVRLEVRGGAVVSWHAGSIVVRRVAGPVALETVDLSAELRRPVPALPGAREARTLVLRLRGAEPADSPRHVVDGDLLTVRAPLPAEVPAATRRRLEALVARVRREVQWTPIAGDDLDLVRRTGLGDCTEQAALLVAHAEEAGLDAEVATGLVYRDEPAPGFYPHAWVEVRLEDLVVPVDPALDQAVADATHVAFRHGLSVLDELRLEVVEIR